MSFFFELFKIAAKIPTDERNLPIKKIYLIELHLFYIENWELKWRDRNSQYSRRIGSFSVASDCKICPPKNKKRNQLIKYEKGKFEWISRT